jgi:hypothetical protein
MLLMSSLPIRRRWPRIEDEGEDTSDYASFAGKNAPRASTLRKSVNYGERDALEEHSSDVLTDEQDQDEEDEEQDDGEEVPKAKKKVKKSWREYEMQGDAIEGIFDHKRNEDMGKSLVHAQSACQLIEDLT